MGRTNAALSGAAPEGDRGIGKMRVWDPSGLGGLRVGRCIGAAALPPAHPPSGPCQRDTRAALGCTLVLLVSAVGQSLEPHRRGAVLPKELLAMRVGQWKGTELSAPGS